MSLENENFIFSRSLDCELYLKITQETMSIIQNIPCSNKLFLSPKPGRLLKTN